jgi:pyruvate dehydrogenase E2 component (dihydrolipoamide acetyltransferase)
MATSVVMPALELAQETGKVVAWKKQEGDTVTKGEPLLEIETDKAVVEVEAPGNGVLTAISAKVGDDIPVGRVIAWLLAPGEALPAEHGSPAPTGRTSSRGPERPATIAAAPAAAAATTVSAPRLSPKARRLAQEHGLDLARLKGTGAGGEILASDIEAAIQSRGGAGPAAAQTESVGTVWKLMAERTAQSWTTVPHFFLTREVDASALVQHRSPLKDKGVTYTDLLVALVARVLQAHPRINGTWTGSGIALNSEINVGVAVAGDDGVTVAVVRNAATSSLEQVAAERQATIDRARTGRAKPSDLAGATFTISNLGMRRVDAFTAIINAPQAAILAVGSIVDRVVAVDGSPAVRPMLTLTLSSDHRVIDGSRAAAFMDDLAGAIGDPRTCLK